MSRIVPCPRCQQPLDVGQAAPYSTVRCPRCQAALQVPSPIGQASATVEPTPRYPAYRPVKSVRRRKQDFTPLVMGVAALAVLVCFGVVAAFRGQSETVVQHSSPQPKKTESASARSTPAQEANAASPARAVSARGPRTAAPTIASEEAELPESEQRPLLPAMNDAPESLDARPMVMNEPPPGAHRLEAPTSQTPSLSESPQDAGQPEEYSATTARQEPERLTGEARERLIAENRTRKLVQSRFERQPRESNRFARGSLDDYFIVARYEMSRETRIADLRFEILKGVETSAIQVTQDLLATPPTSVRDFQVVARFATQEEAETGIAVVRQRYDEAKQYQAQLLAYLQEQQRVQALAMRRC